MAARPPWLAAKNRLTRDESLGDQAQGRYSRPGACESLGRPAAPARRRCDRPDAAQGAADEHRTTAASGISPDPKDAAVRTPHTNRLSERSSHFV